MQPATAAMPLDDRTLRYVLDTRPSFENLRQVASQLAGLLVLAASGADMAGPRHPLIDAAAGTLRDAAALVRQARPTPRARRHHRHLLAALVAFETATMAARRLHDAGTEDVDAVLLPLRYGYEHLRNAADRLPGFELVALSRGCCASGQEGQVGQIGQVGKKDS
jgi:hypothetical protein